MNHRKRTSPILTDDEIIGLFSDLEPLGNYMLVVTKKVDRRTEGGIRKTDQRLQQEKQEIKCDRALVIAVGPEVERVRLYGPSPIGLSSRKARELRVLWPSSPSTKVNRHIESANRN